MRAAMIPSFRAASASSNHWGTAVKTAATRLGPLPGDANIGILYVAPALAQDLVSIVTFLRETTPIADWIGGIGYAVLGPTDDSGAEPTLVLMAGRLKDDAVRPFPGSDPADFIHRHGAWLDRQHSATALIHGDPRDPTLSTALAILAESGPIFAIGGLTAPLAEADLPARSAGVMRRSGLSGALFGEDIDILVGLSQGSHPIGPLHEVSEAVDNVVISLDDRSALSLLKEESGEQDLRRVRDTVHVALPDEGSDDRRAYRARNLAAIDPVRGWLALEQETLRKGDRLMFARGDATAARRDMGRMLDGMARRLAGRPIRAGLYISCWKRDAWLSESGPAEAEMIRDALGDFPLIGFSSSGEICRDRLFAFTGLLTLFL